MFSSKPRTIFKGFNYLLLRYVFKKTLLHSHSDFLNASFQCYSEDVLGRHLYKYGIHEHENSEFLIKNIKLSSGEIAIDVGANLGWFSVLLHRVSNPKSKIYSFEPDPHNFQLLEYNLKRNHCNNVSAVKSAISDKTDELDLFLYPRKNLGFNRLDIN